MQCNGVASDGKSPPPSEESSELEEDDDDDEQSPEGSSSQELCQRRTVPIVPRNESDCSQGCSLTACLSQFTGEERLTGKNRYRCENCAKTPPPPPDEPSSGKGAHSKRLSVGKDSNNAKELYTDADRHYLIYDPPAVLTLHLKRFQQVGKVSRQSLKLITHGLLLQLQQSIGY